MEREERRCLVYSTMHMERRDADLFDNSRVFVDHIRFGWLVWAGSDEDSQLWLSWLKELSPAAQAVVEDARSKDSDFVVFDQDGPVYDDLPSHEW